MSLLLIKKYLELQSQFQYSQSNLLQILTKQQIMYNRQLDALCASYQSSQYSINLSPYSHSIIPSTGEKVVVTLLVVTEALVEVIVSVWK